VDCKKLEGKRASELELARGLEEEEGIEEANKNGRSLKYSPSLLASGFDCSFTHEARKRRLKLS